MSTQTAGRHDHAHSSVFSRRPVLTGVAVGIGSLLPHAFLPPDASLAFAAILIALIAGIYFGFAVVNGSGAQQMIEFNVSALFAVAGLLGLLYWPVLVAIAYFAHAAWDFAHHNRVRRALVEIPQWYVPWCVVIDVIVGAGLLVIWHRHGLL
ncbi:DUF6010 family protein [Lysobacter niastensis]|uniref:Uncharacterized protein n=1 Tax=Lysobacter niastensis TaxID=380629 RepID=A0ABS0B3A2_9GAMM|nr:DUF6010 family protein [Lysobacter niastensis]MBF6022954.1 hypothetical protein [Lysobacter niastensis]